MNYTPEISPLGPLWLSALVGLLPLATIFITLGWLRWKAHWAGLAARRRRDPGGDLRLDAGRTVLAGRLQGVVYGLFPIMWIVIAAIWLYQLTVVSGRFEDLRTAFNRVSDDPRIQGIIIAFCFGGLLEALAGFGAPVAITGVMLVSLGFSAMRAAATVLLANTAPVAFGAIAIPIITAGNLTGIDYHEIGAVVGRQTPLLAVVRSADAGDASSTASAASSRPGRSRWSPGSAFAIAQFVSSNYISVELTDIIASLVGLVAVVVMLRFWQPKGGEEARERLHRDREAETDTRCRQRVAGGRAAGVATDGDRPARS